MGGGQCQRAPSPPGRGILPGGGSASPPLALRSGEGRGLHPPGEEDAAEPADGNQHGLVVEPLDVYLA